MEPVSPMTDINNNGNVTPEPGKSGLPGRLKSLIPLTFRGQALLFLFPAIVIISMVYTVESVYSERKILRKEIVKKGETIAAIVARNSELPLLSENLEQLKGAANSVMGIPDIAFVEFLDRHSRVLLHEGKHHVRKAVTSVDSDRMTGFYEHDDLFELIVPVVSVKATEELFLLEGPGSMPTVREQVGWVRIGLSKEVMNRSEYAIMVRGAIMAVLFSAAGTFLLYLFISYFTRPLYALINAVKEVREGEHSEVAVESPKSEIGRLSTEFNRMSRAIRKREEELQENVLELEMTQHELQENVLELEMTQNELQENVQELEMQIEAREVAEMELVKYRDHLEDLVEERTKELMAAKVQAESASRAKSDFLASMSHELRTPLNAILGYAQILIHHENLTDAQRQQLGIMRGSGEHLLTLINDILEVGKIEAAKIEIESLVFDLPALLKQVFNLTKLHAEEKELKFEYHVEGSLPTYVRGDERKLRQVLLNLLSNAVKYTHKGGVELRVSYGREAAEQFRCEVVDSGIGIPSDKLEAIFEPFTQLVADRQVSEGTGLGLNITKRLLELMGGRISVESVTGQGSTFRIELCLPALVNDEIALEKTESNVTGYSGQRKRILVVDDNVSNTSMLISLLEPLGFEINTAQTGREALMRAEQQQPDLVLLDLVMPEMNGLEVAALIRENPALAGTRIIGASATVTDIACKKSFVAICDDFVPKPIRVDLLLEKIGKLLGIEWIYALQENAGVEDGQGEAGCEEAFVVPPAAEIEELHELALLGDMQKIESWATELAARDHVYGCFTGKLLELAGGFKTKAILTLVEQCRGEQR